MYICFEKHINKHIHAHVCIYVWKYCMFVVVSEKLTIICHNKKGVLTSFHAHTHTHTHLQKWTANKWNALCKFTFKHTYILIYVCAYGSTYVLAFSTLTYIYMYVCLCKIFIYLDYFTCVWLDVWLAVLLAGAKSSIYDINTLMWACQWRSAEDARVRNYEMNGDLRNVKNFKI